MDQPDLADLYIAPRPRRPARGRQADQLILYLHMLGGLPLPRQEQDQILEKSASAFFSAPGSVTAALRTLVGALNQFLYTRNQRLPVEGQRTAGLMAALVQREDQAYLAISGPLQAYLIAGDGVQHLVDYDAAGRGLGLIQEPPLRYFHASLQPNDTLLLTARQAPGWSKVGMSGLHGQGPDSIRRHLLSQSPNDIHAVLVQARPGKGQVRLLRAAPSEQVQPPPVAGVSAPVEPPASPPQAYMTVQQVSEQAAAEQVAPPPSPPPFSAPMDANTEQPEELALLEEADSMAQTAPVSSQAAPPLSQDQGKPPPPQTVAQPSPAEKPSTPAGGGRRWGTGLRNFLQRLVPDETLSSVSNTTLALIAVAVPLVVVAVATMVYIQRGLAVQSQAYYLEALKAADQAQTQTDPDAQRAAWENVLIQLNNSEAVQVFPEAAALQDRARASLDGLDGVKRLDYRQALAVGLPETALVKKLLAASDELYLLDAFSGSVLRAVFDGQVYQLDQAFLCGPGVAPGVTQPVVDIELWPSGNQPSAALLAMDAGGGLLFCQPGQTPQTGQLAAPPSGSLENLLAFDLDSGALYALDPGSNAVWLYDDRDFSQPPKLFFDDYIPSLKEAADLAVNDDQLYLLRKDGSMVLCQYSALSVAPTQCQDPAAYQDNRAGRENTTMQPDQPFNQVSDNPPPDPSLYLLQPGSQSIYRFSLGSLVYHSQYRPSDRLASGDATTFAVDPVQRLVFLAVGNQVYYAYIPL
jgi:hypothetical protein